MSKWLLRKGWGDAHDDAAKTSGRRHTSQIMCFGDSPRSRGSLRSRVSRESRDIATDTGGRRVEFEAKLLYPQQKFEINIEGLG